MGQSETVDGIWRTSPVVLPHTTLTTLLENCSAGQPANALVLIIGYYHPFIY